MSAWFLTNGFGPEHHSFAGTAGLLLAVEVVSRGSEIVDRVIKKAEYAKAGIPRSWVIERDTVTTVHRHVLNTSTGEYEPDEGS
ncbi:Uma2 family endonuclease [Actinoplanes sp. G11-F43]|uniref:Uma2 family endonuclease n=1 Tax=Actinoplanes sp. G11-F43 TaxID=3424130 RepID=UPI003D32526C